MNKWKVLSNHIWKLLDQCYLARAVGGGTSTTLCENKKLKLSHLIVSSRILLFRIQKIFWTEGNTKLYKFQNCFERLQLKFEATKGEQDLQVLRRQKILAFCQRLRWSIEEAT